MQGFAGRAAIVGIGATPITRNSGVPVADLAAEAVLGALADAGIDPAEVDGMLSYHANDSLPSVALAGQLGLTDLGWFADYAGGGQYAASVLGSAAMLIDSGIAEVVVVYRALNGRSGKRMGQVDVGWGDDAAFYRAYGLAGPVQLFAVAAQRYLYRTGATNDDLAAVALQFRANAARNPGALLREPLTLEQYYASPYVATPLRRLDCCQETDAGWAGVLTSTPRARASGRPSAVVRAVVRGGGPGATSPDRATDMSLLFSQYLAPKLWDAAGMQPADVGLAQVYDAYSWVVLAQLEDFGFAPPGQTGDLLRAGAFGPGGQLAVNTNGGLLSEGYVHGFNNVLETVRQLRGEAGERQVPNLTAALCAGFSGSFGSAAILTRED